MSENRPEVSNVAPGQPHDSMLSETLSYVLGLGLIRLRGGAMEIANPIYREVIPRALTYAQQVTLPYQPAWYVCPDGTLNTTKLIMDCIRRCVRRTSPGSAPPRSDAATMKMQ